MGPSKTDAGSSGEIDLVFKKGIKRKFYCVKDSFPVDFSLWIDNRIYTWMNDLFFCNTDIQPHFGNIW